MKEFQGIIPPAVTPLTPERELDVPGLERLIEHMISGGIHGIFILGTTGEGPALSEAVQHLMIRETLRIVRGRIPVLAGVSSASFSQTVQLARFAGKSGADAAVAAPPCYFLPGEPELLDFYSALASEIKMPLFAYNMPGMTKVYMKPDFVCKLASVPGIKGYKDSSGNMPIEESFSLIDFLGKQKVSLVLQGHDHYREETTYNNVRYTVLGAISDKMEAPEYLKVNVDKNGVHLEWHTEL